MNTANVLKLGVQFGRASGLLFLLATISLAQVLVVGTKKPTGEISFRTVEDVTIEGKRGVRFLKPPAGNVDNNAVKRLQKVDLDETTGLIRNDGAGHVVRWTDNGKTVETLLPDSLQLKAPVPAAGIQGRLAITLLISKKSKQVETIAPEVFFVFLHGASGERLVLDLIQQDWAFLNLDEQLAAMSGFVASFRTTPAVTEFRGIMDKKLNDGLAAFENGGQYADLLTLHRFSIMARAAFADDSNFATLDGRVAERIEFVENRLATLRSLAAAGEWDALLDRYGEFERYQWSFKDIVALRREALEESARIHSRRARAYSQRGDHEVAAKEARTAQMRDPENKEIFNLQDGEHSLASQLDARKAVAQRRRLPENSPELRVFTRSLSDLSRAIQDKDFRRADDAIREAERTDGAAPEVVLGKAQLAYSQGLLADAVPLLDQYDRLVVERADRAASDELRNKILYDLDTLKRQAAKEVQTLTESGEYTKLSKALAGFLRGNGNDPELLYQAGVVTAMLRQPARAKQLLNGYLENSVSLAGDPARRDKAGRVLTAMNASAPPATGRANWMSARKLPDGVYYCPESLAFQLPFDSVTGNGVRMAFTWNKNRLESVKTTFEELPKGVRAYKQLSAPGSPEHDWPGLAAEKMGNFSFGYVGDDGPLVRVNDDGPAQGIAKLEDLELKVTKGVLTDGKGQPVLGLLSSPYIDTQVFQFLGTNVATTVAGNAFFNPFLWDGVHYFALTYDSQGRAESAQERDVDNLLRFRWDGNRLAEITGFHKGSTTPYYKRAIVYTAGQIDREDYTIDGRQGHIDYSYNNKVLREIKVEQDGKTWVVRPR